MIQLQRRHTGNIEVSYHGTKPYNCTEFFKYILDAYGFLLPYNFIATTKQFADLIEGYYDTDNPNNKEAVEYLRSL
jgi:hypothetical protein